jgi:hypothetical protein
MRSLLVVVWVGAVAAGAAYVAHRPTLARGSVLAADLKQSNAGTVVDLACDPEVPIGVAGASFACDVTFRAGGRSRLEFHMDREGQIQQDTTPHEQFKRTSDPWGD